MMIAKLPGRAPIRTGVRTLCNRPRAVFFTGFVCWCLATSAVADDWPVYQQNHQRNAKTTEQLTAEELTLSWTWRSPQVPQPAWWGPAKWDAYAEIRGLKSMRNYDPVFHLISVGDRVWFGSNVDDAVHCLDATTGREIWSYTTDGPVRAAPAYADGRLYFGSDDGCAYCVDEDGQLVWKYEAQPCSRRIVNNGRFISTWPIRTGVLVEDGKAVFGASLLPWQESYLCAVDARTGSDDEPGCFVRRVYESTMEGPMAVFPGRALVSPQGRIPPRLFALQDGRPLGSLKGGGGSFVVLTKDSVFHGPGNKTGWLTASSLDSLETVASFDKGNAIVVAGDVCFILTDDALTASNYVTKEILWTAKSDCRFALALAGETLWVGGQDQVVARSSRDGQEIWSHAVDGKAYGLAVANGRLLVSTDTGAIQAFQAGVVRQDHAGSLSVAAASDEVPEPVPNRSDDAQGTDRVAFGPWWQFTAHQTAVFRWRTKLPSPSYLTLRQDGRIVQQFVDDAARLDHEVTLKGLRHNMIYTVQIEFLDEGTRRQTTEYECDTFFNYRPPAISAASESISDPRQQEARTILEATQASGGLGLCLGCEEGELIESLLRASTLRIVAFDTDEDRVRAVRRRWQRQGLYGVRATAHLVESLEQIPITGRVANLIVSESPTIDGGWRIPLRETQRLLAPGGKACIESPDAQTQLPEAWEAITALQLDSGRWFTLEGRAIPEAGVWTHIYGTAANNHYGGEALGGVRTAPELTVQWIGRPGPRYQADRNGRKPPPLAVGGRLFLQGLHRLLALDQYNGSILWSLEIPGLDRYNMPRDCGNWCADEQSLYVALHDKCWKISTADGSLQQTFELDSTSPASPQFDWGYIAREADLLIGSAARAGASWTSFWGGEGWYDGTEGPVTYKVCSDRLFVRGAERGELRWQYEKGPILNSTITVADELVYFVEARGEFLKGLADRRLGGDAFWRDQYLVALDLHTGQVKWKRPLDTADGTIAFYAAYGDSTLVLVSSTKLQYFVYAVEGQTGKDLWNAAIPWGKGKADHGSHLSRPAIVGQRLYVRPGVFDLRTGELLPLQIPVGGCGTYAATKKALFFRAGSGKNSAMWDQQAGEFTTWDRLRPDCWLSTIPVGGMLLSPEGGGGCSCGSWLETSVGFIPRQTLEP